MRLHCRKRISIDASESLNMRFFGLSCIFRSEYISLHEKWQRNMIFEIPYIHEWTKNVNYSILKHLESIFWIPPISVQYSAQRTKTIYRVYCFAKEHETFTDDLLYCRIEISIFLITGYGQNRFCDNFRRLTIKDTIAFMLAKRARKLCQHTCLEISTCPNYALRRREE